MREEYVMVNLKVNPMKEPDKIINYWKKEKIIVSLIIIFGLAYDISIVLGPIYQGKLIDAIVNGNSMNSIVIVAASFVIIIASIQIFRYFKRFYIRRFANTTSATMRFMIYNNILHKSAAELDEENTGNLMTRVISDVQLCVEGMRKFSTEIFDTGVMMITYVVSMIMYDFKITLLSMIFIPAAMLLADKLKVVIYKYSTQYRSKISKVTDITYNTIENAILYRINGMESKNRIIYNEELEDLYNKAIKANLIENSMRPVYNVIAMFGVIIVIYFGGKNVISGVWTVGNFTTYILMFSAMSRKTSSAAKLFNSIQKSQVSWKRIKPYLAEYSIKDKTMDFDVHNTNFDVNNLSFIYPLGKNNIIDNITFSGKNGEIIGVTGPIVSGKSTLGISLLGIYPYIGSIKIDNKELNDYSDYERSQIISYLGHKPQLLSDSIYNNITLGNQKDISQVLKDVCFDIDLNEMPNRENTLVGNGGVRLSGGQQSRIALARALLNKNKIIILDDPFSAVDMQTEEKIIDNLRKNYSESLIILISHRLTIFRKINHIILLHNDKTVEYGKHNEFMENSKLYQTIYNLQCAVGDENGEE
ncbi:ABC-type multidrug transport system fused ATPase/permease subunit [Sedimentibacter acidaminivorans]|uniref:ABC-type multidrug transport system fused ATPase/permease subunit n=1 Tax=Sedimentibacter acidaminivorans TaxID=913099 RepID=A0ABS4GAL9_9FIRM|nr:ABC transporter ATP-binding protein [Sedimentibacter acidaminivorans]MBP1924730.1 ABC-type multidrug transport system fused ATPase/permease subunit [Sedimentibacter acidaminivorans]